MLFTTSQIEKLHDFDQDVVKRNWEENVNEFKLLGIAMDKNLSRKKHINNTTKNCYATLSVPHKIKIYTPLPVREQLAESLILSKLN